MSRRVKEGMRGTVIKCRSLREFKEYTNKGKIVVDDREKMIEEKSFIYCFIDECRHSMQKILPRHC